MPQITQSDIFGDPSLWTPLAPYGGTPLGAYPDTYGLGQTGYGQQGPSLGGQPPPYGGGAGGYQPPAYGGGAAGYQPPPFDPGAFVGGGGGGQPQSFQDSGGGALTTGLGALSALSAADKYLLDGQLGASAKEFLGNIPIPGGSNIADLFGLGPSPYEYSVAQGEGALTGLGEFSGPSRAVMDRAIAASAPPIAQTPPPTPGFSPLDFQTPPPTPGPSPLDYQTPPPVDATSMRHIAPPGASFANKMELDSFAELMDAGGVPTGAAQAARQAALGGEALFGEGAQAAQAARAAQAAQAGLGALGGQAAAQGASLIGAGSGPMSFGAVPANIMVGGGGPLAGLAQLGPYAGAGMAAISALKRLGRSSNKYAVQAMDEGTGAAFQAITNPNFGLPQAQRFASLTGLPFDDYGEYGDPRTLETGANVGGLFNRIEAAGGRAALSPSAQRLYDDLRNHQVVLQERKNAESLAALGLPADAVRPDPVPFYSPGQAGGQPSLPVPDYRQIQPYDPRLLQQVMPSSSGQTYGDTAAGRLLKQGMSPSQVDEYLRNVGP